MALIKCRECGNDVSTEAAACPKCGVPLRRKPIGCLTFIFIGVSIVVIGFIVISIVSPRPTRPVNTDVVHNDGSGVFQVKQYLKQTLRDPASYEGIEWGQIVKKPKGGFVVWHKYRAKNGFGGYTVERRIFELDAQGNVTESEDWPL